MARHFNPNNRADRAAWYRQSAARLQSIGKFREAENQLKIADILEQELKDNRRCKACSRPLVDRESVELGIGPDCRRKLLGIAS